MADIDLAALDIFRRQAGVILGRQAKSLGMSARQIQYRVGRGDWIVVRRGVYRHRAFRLSDAMTVFGLTLGGNGHASHRYAAMLHGLEPTLAPPGDTVCPEVTVRRGTHQNLGRIIVHESTQMDRAEVTIIDGIPTSGVERTIMDVGAVCKDISTTLALIDSARRKGLTDPSALGECLARNARQGRDGTVQFRNALEILKARSTPAIGHLSRRVAELSTAAGLPYPLLEERVDLGDDRFTFLDLSWVLPMCAYLDGWTYHKSRREQTNTDHLIRQTLRNRGLYVLEFTADQIYRHPGFVIESIRTTHAQAHRAVRLDPGRFRWWTERFETGRSTGETA